MAKFCGQCGAELRDTATFCDSCGTKCAEINTPVAEPVAQNTSTPPVSQQTPVSQKSAGGTSDSKPAKKSKKGLFIAIIAVVLVVAIALTTVFVILPMLKKSSDDEKGYTVAGKDYITFKSPDTRYYISGNDFLDVNQEDADMSIVSMGANVSFHYLNSLVSLGDSSYAIFRNFNDNNSEQLALHKITYDDPANHKENNIASDSDLSSVPVVEKWLAAEDITNIDNVHADAIMFCAREWQHSDGYLYFSINYFREYYEAFYDAVYKFGRINIKDKSVELIAQDIAVSDYVVYDGWVYYCDNGFNREEATSRIYNADRAGLYKMKTDGSEQTKLLDFNCEDELDYLHNGYSVYSEMSVYNGKLYYIDNTDPFNSILYRMNFDGSNIEKVSTQGTYEYTFDTNTNKLYYITSSYFPDNTKDVKEIYEVNLDDFSETKFADYARRSDRIQLSCVDSKLFISSPNQGFGSYNIVGSEDDPAFVGIYYDLKEKKATVAYSYGIKGEDKTISTPAGEIVQEGTIEKYVFYWADYDTSDDLFTFYN